MKEVKIFIETSLCGPCAPREGYYAAIIECQTAKGPATAGIVGVEEETTWNRSTLLAAVEALRKLKPGCKVKFYTYCIFFKSTIERDGPEVWKRSEWKSASGDDVKHKELWEEFLDLAKGHEISVAFSKHNDYRDLLRKMIREKREKIEEKPENTKRSGDSE